MDKGQKSHDHLNRQKWKTIIWQNLIHFVIKQNNKKIGIKGNFLNFISSIYKTNKGKTANITHNGAKLESFPWDEEKKIDI